MLSAKKGMALLLIAALAFAGPAFAWKKGISTSQGVLILGADTPSDFGGASYGDLGYGGAPGTLILGSVTPTNPGDVTSFVLDADNFLVLAGTRGTAAPAALQSCPTPSPALPSAPTSGECYTLHLSGFAYKKDVKVFVYQQAASATTRCAQVDSPSAPTACTGGAVNDAPTSSELRTLVNTDWGAVSGHPASTPETLLWRNTPSWQGVTSPSNQAISPGFAQVVAATQFKFLIPQGGAGGYTNGASVIITPEHAGAGAPLGPICVDSGNKDVNIAVTLKGVTRTINITNPSVSLNMLSNCSIAAGWGIVEDSNTVFYGPNVDQGHYAGLFHIDYRPPAGSPCIISDSTCIAATSKNTKYGVGVQGFTYGGGSTALSIIDGRQPSGATLAGVPWVAAIVLNDTFTGFHADSVDVAPTPLTDVEGNLFYAPNGCCGFHPDSLQLFVATTGRWMDFGGTFAYNLGLRGMQSLGNTVKSGDCTHPGTSCGVVPGPANGTASGVQVSCVPAKPCHGWGGRVNVVLDASGFVKTITGINSEGNGGYYLAGDEVSVDGCCGSLSGTDLFVGLSSARGDMQGDIFFNAHQYKLTANANSSGGTTIQTSSALICFGVAGACPGMTVLDLTTPSAVPANTYVVSRADAGGNTTMTVSAAVTVASGDIVTYSNDIIVPGTHAACKQGGTVNSGLCVHHNAALTAFDQNGLFTVLTNAQDSYNALYVEDPAVFVGGSLVYGTGAPLQIRIPVLTTSGSAGGLGGVSHFDYIVANTFAINGQTGFAGVPATNSCVPGGPPDFTKPNDNCSVLATTGFGTYLDPYLATPWTDAFVFPLTYAQVIAALVPKLNAGAPFSDNVGHYGGIVWPLDDKGQVCWAIGATAFVGSVKADCTSASTLATLGPPP